MSPEDRKYVRVYYNDLIRDYPDVWADDAQLATWLRLLATADPMWPTPPELPRSVKPRALAALVASSLVALAGHRFQMKGMDAERIRRSDAGRKGAAVRWQNEGNANAMPKRDEHRRDETRRAEPHARDGLPNLDGAAIRALEERTGQPWSQAGDKQLSEYDRLVGAHGLVPVLGAFDAVRDGKRMTARQLVWPALRLLEPFPTLSVVEKNGSDEREANRVQHNLERTKRDIHATGFHQDSPDPTCPACREAGVTA